MFRRCFYVGMAISSAAVFGQGNSDRPQYIPHAEITRAGRMVTIHASSPRPVEQALSAIRREYGLILDYEEGSVRAPSDLVTVGSRQIFKGADIKVTMAGPKDSTLPEQAAFLESVLTDFQAAGGARQFTLLRGANGRLTVTPSDATLRVLDTKILIDPRPRSIDATVEEIFRALNSERGIVIERGGLADNELSNTEVTVGSSSTPIAARDLLSQALSGTVYAKFWILTWDPNTGHYAMNLQTAVKIDDTLIDIQSKYDTPLTQIVAAREHTKYPVGIVLGKRIQGLCEKNNTRLEKITAREALQKSANDAGLSFSENGGMYLIEDNGIAPWMQDILNYRIKSFPALHHVLMDTMGLTLTIWTRELISNVHTFAGSMRGSDNLQFYDLDQSQDLTVQEIANKIAALDQDVIWVMHPINATPQNATDMEFRLIHLKDLERGNFICPAEPVAQAAQ